MKTIKCVGFENGDDIATVIDSALYEWSIFKGPCCFKYELLRGTKVCFSNPHRDVHIHETATQIVLRKI